MKKVALVTGCNGGIGFATVKKFLENGWSVVGMDVAPESIEKLDGFVYVQGDLSKGEDRESFIGEAVKAFGKIDALVNVAGVAPKVRADLLEMTEESYDFVMNINTKGTLFLTQLAAKQMISQRVADEICGYIVNISSMSAYTSSVNRGEYCVSKAGVSMITKLFADRLAPEGVMVNEIRPGIIKTGMTEKVKEKYDNLIGGGLLPLQRWGTPEDIADAVYVLCSGQLPYVIGQSIDVDGGYHIHRL